MIICMVPESSLQLKMLIYNNYGSINLQKKLWDNAMRVYSQILHKCARNRDNHKVASLLKLSEITTKCDAVK